MLLEAFYWIFTLVVDWRIYFTVILIYVIYFYMKFVFSGLPPGPIPFPLVGNILQLGIQAHLSLMKLGETYSDVFTVYLATKPAVVLNSYEAVTEALVKNGHTTSGRPSTFYMERVRKGRNGKYTSNHNHFSQTNQL